jgi:hypothetical protein
MVTTRDGFELCTGTLLQYSTFIYVYFTARKNAQMHVVDEPKPPARRSTRSYSKKTMKVVALFAVFIALTIISVASFSASPQPNIVASIKAAFGSFVTQGAPDLDAVKREELKACLLEECRQRTPKPSRERIESLIADLADLTPTPNAASSERLQKQWIL